MDGDSKHACLLKMNPFKLLVILILTNYSYNYFPTKHIGSYHIIPRDCSVITCQWGTNFPFFKFRLCSHLEVIGPYHSC